MSLVEIVQNPFVHPDLCGSCLLPLSCDLWRSETPLCFYTSFNTRFRMWILFVLSQRQRASFRLFSGLSESLVGLYFCVDVLQRFSLLFFSSSVLVVSSVFRIDQGVNTHRIQPFHFIQCGDNTWATIRARVFPFALTLKFIIWARCHMDHVRWRKTPPHYIISDQ